MVVVNHLFLFSMYKFKGRHDLHQVLSAPVWNYLLPDIPFYHLTKHHRCCTHHRRRTHRHRRDRRPHDLRRVHAPVLTPIRLCPFKAPAASFPDSLFRTDRPYSTELLTDRMFCSSA